uniref:Mu-like prophage tail protein gpP n=1 Tax=Candidatus Kentrum sp. LFY TaxID=2126342 RepID=A0A450UEB5_9GAMM|nr:MAG: Mu-like prophage tail protein gpP [Candidatus Kentron sp. LFY]
MDNKVEIRFDGKRYAFWQEVSIRFSVDDLCSSVSLSITRPGAGDGLGITANTIIEVMIGGHLVATVRPDSLTREVDKENHSIHLAARSLGRELVDCRYSQTMLGLTLEDIMKRICGAFEVPLKVLTKTAVTPNFAMQCESPANALINAVRTANLLLYPMQNGGLVLTKPTDAAPVATLVYGEHILHYRITDEFKLRFSEYTIKGYDYSSNHDLDGTVKDDGVSYHRPLQLVADRHGRGLGGCERRAELERDRRRARARRLDLRILGWRGQNGGLWGINTKVRVVIPQEGIDGVFLIGDCDFRLDDRGGGITHLQLMERGAFGR